MLKLENAILKHENRILSQRIAFDALNAPKYRSNDLVNKELYLNYVEEVLEKKQQDLIELERYLNLRQNQINSLSYQKTFKRAFDILLQIRQHEEIFLEFNNPSNNQEIRRTVLGECERQRSEIQKILKIEFDNIVEERKVLRKKIGQYTELSSYEKYLNELHDALEVKQQEITERENSLQNQSLCSMKNPSDRYTSKASSQRKRVKIFSTKSINPGHISWQQNQTFAEKQSLPEVNESSEIKQECKLCRQKETKGVQVSLQTFNSAQKRIKNEERKLKFIKKWLQASFSKVSSKKQKILGLYLWKLNACHAENISQQMKTTLSTIDRNWQSHTKKLQQQQLFPYHKLSTNRKNYLEHSFDLDRKILHRKTIENSLKSIVKNKVRKERLVFYYYFFRFFKNTMTKIQRPKHQQKSTHSFIESSQVLSEERISTPSIQKKGNNLNKSEVVEAKKQQKKEKSRKVSDFKKKKEKENTPVKNKEGSPDDSKLKEYVYQKQRIEKMLATQCVKMEGLIKMLQVLTPTTFRTKNEVLSILKEKDCADRMKKLTSTINNMEFKMDLFITKCRLGIANNGNKISTLEGLLGFTSFMK